MKQIAKLIVIFLVLISIYIISGSFISHEDSTGFDLIFADNESSIKEDYMNKLVFVKPSDKVEKVVFVNEKSEKFVYELEKEDIGNLLKDKNLLSNSDMSNVDTTTKDEIINAVISHTGQFHTASISYLLLAVFLFVSMVVILGGCEVFANGIECVGSRLEMSHATVGSLMAAVGTALPETLLPIMALIFGDAAHKEGIAVGAILGAPFMLTTLAMFFLGLTTLILSKLKKREKAIFAPNRKAFEIDLLFFIPTMIVILVVSLIGVSGVNYIGAIVLVVIYVVFFKYALGHEAEAGEEYVEDFYFSKYLYCPKNMTYIITQVVFGLLFIVIGAHIFIEYITVFSIKSGISALLLSLIIAPIATELPEKFNSITWTIKKKDTLAMANISGAMVFQSTVPVSVGLLFTTWALSQREIVNIVCAIIMAIILLLVVRLKKALPAWSLLIGGGFYAFYIYYIFG